MRDPPFGEFLVNGVFYFDNLSIVLGIWRSIVKQSPDPREKRCWKNGHNLWFLCLKGLQFHSGVPF